MRALVFLLLALLHPLAHCQQKKSEAVFFAPAFGISYPFIVSVGAGALVPFGRTDPETVFPSVASLRADVEAGLGGGTLAAGLYVPTDAFAFNVKAASLRTWLAAWGQPNDRTYDGVILEVVALGHVPGKLGLGTFRERAQGDSGRDQLTYLFLGVGF